MLKGIHTADAQRRRRGLPRGGLFIAARGIAGAAHGGQIVVSQATQAFLDDSEAALGPITFDDLGEHALKDFDRPVRIYQVLAEGLTKSFRRCAAQREPRRRCAQHPRTRPA